MTGVGYMTYDSDYNRLYIQFEIELYDKQATLEYLKFSEEEAYTDVRLKISENFCALMEKHTSLTSIKDTKIVSKIMKNKHFCVIKQNFLKQRKAIMENKPFSNWGSFLRFKARTGNETANKILKNLEITY
jgi:hypothetical protein